MSRLSGLYAEKTIDFAPITDGVSSTTVTVPGAKMGDFVVATLDSITDAMADDLLQSAFVSSDNTVTYCLRADATGANPGSGTLRVKVIPIDAI